MSRTVLALPLIACLAAVAGSVHAQSTAYLYVGADNQQQNNGFGTALVSATGTVASGTFAFVGGGNPSTTDFKGLSAFGSGQITVTGGTFQQLLAADPNSSVNLVGDNLAQSKNFQVDNFGQAWYTISGTIKQSQTLFTALWYAPSEGKLEFNGVQAVPGAAPVPEASTVVSLGLLLLGTVGIAFKRRKTIA